MTKEDLETLKQKYDTEILQIRNDLIFNDLFNENNMETVEWAVSKILDCDIDKIKGKVTFKNIRLPKRHILEKQKYVDLLVEFEGKDILIELNNNYGGLYLRNLLYTFEVILSRYTIGSNYDDVASTAILVNLNWHKNKKIAKETKIKNVEYLHYDETNPNKILIKIININLDKYENISYNETVNEDKFYKLLTISKRDELKSIESSEKSLKSYTKHLGNLSTSVKFREDFMSYEMNEYLANLERMIRIKEERDEARSIGHKEGYSNGLKEGIKEGYSSGHNEGYNNGTQDTKRNMIIALNKKDVSLDIITDVSGLSIDEVKKIIANSKE